jgi:hypothetical protein
MRSKIQDLFIPKSEITVNIESNQSYCVNPIFVIGCFRSGTSLIRYIIDSHKNICCPPETKFLNSIKTLYSDEDSMKALLQLGYSDEYILRSIRHFAESIYIPYMKYEKKIRWADKTPEYIFILEFIEKIFGPGCQYILIFRNGLDVANSINANYIKSLEKNKSLKSSILYWIEATEKMLLWKEIHPHRCFSIYYEELCDNIEKNLIDLFYFLGESWDPNVMQWYAKKRLHGFEDHKVRYLRSINKSFGSFKKWNTSDYREILDLASPTLERAGYNLETLTPENV